MINQPATPRARNILPQRLWPVFPYALPLGICSSVSVTGEDSPLTDGTKTRVVVAEDEVLIRLDLVEMLTEEGYDVIAGQAVEVAVALTTISGRIWW